jgi:hypothetical protein
MAGANTLAFYNTATITAVKGFIVKASEESMLQKPILSSLIFGKAKRIECIRSLCRKTDVLSCHSCLKTLALKK